MNSPDSFVQNAAPWKRIILNHRITVSTIFGIAALFFVRPSLQAILCGLPLIILGEVIRLWASGHIHKMAEVTRTGPYALCRHPLYLGHFFITIGFLTAAGNLWLIPAGVVAFLLIFLPTMEREENFLTNQFGDEYSRYSETVPRFMPRWNAEATHGTFDWQLVKRHRELNNIYGLLGGLVAFAALGVWLDTW